MTLVPRDITCPIYKSRQNPHAVVLTIEQMWSLTHQKRSLQLPKFKAHQSKILICIYSNGRRRSSLYDARAPYDSFIGLKGAGSIAREKSGERGGVQFGEWSRCQPQVCKMIACLLRAQSNKVLNTAYQIILWGQTSRKVAFFSMT